MGKLKQALIDTDIDLSEAQHNRVITMWNEKADLHTNAVTAQEYAQSAVLSVALLALIAIVSSLYKAQQVEETLPLQEPTKVSYSSSQELSDNEYRLTRFRYTGTIQHIDIQTERM